MKSWLTTGWLPKRPLCIRYTFLYQSLHCISLPISKTKRHIYLRYHIRVILVCLIFFWSWKMPNMSASLVGGQPGT